MDRNHIAVFLFMVLCWMSAGTYAETNTTTEAANVTTPSLNMTAPSANATATNGTSALSTNATATNATSAPSSNVTATNATSAPSSNVTATNATSAPSLNMTAPSVNATAANTTATVPTSTAPPIVTNTTVTVLTNNISRSDCGSKEFCTAQPSNCDPSSTSASCVFLGLNRTSGRNFGFSLAGESDGYLGVSLSSAGNNDTVYVCAKNNSNAQFVSGSFYNGTFIIIGDPHVNNIRVKINGRRIQCTFDATVPNATARGADTTFSVAVVNGTYDPATGVGFPNFLIRTSPLDLTVPTANADNVLQSTASPTTSHAITVQQTVSTGLLLILSTLSLAWF